MNGVLKASVSAGSSHLGASVTCSPHRSSPSAANAGGMHTIKARNRLKAESRLKARTRRRALNEVMAKTLGRRQGKVKSESPAPRALAWLDEVVLLVDHDDPVGVH